MLAEPKPSRYSWAPVRRLRQTFRATHYDAALAYLPVPNLYALLAGLGLKNRPPIIVSERGTPPAGKGSLPHQLIERCYGRADHLIVNSYHLADYYRQKYRRLAERVSTIWNSVELKFPPRRRCPSRASCDCSPWGTCDRRRIGIASWTASAILRDQHGRRPIVDYAGRLTELNAEDSAYLKSLEGANRPTETCRAVAVPRARSDVPQLFATHHALVHPSYLEGLPNVVCETLASGRPVVLSNTLDHPRLRATRQNRLALRLAFPRRPRANARPTLRTLRRPVVHDEPSRPPLRRQPAFAPERFLDEYETLFTRVAGRKTEIGDRNINDPAPDARSSFIAHRS